MDTKNAHHFTDPKDHIHSPSKILENTDIECQHNDVLLLILNTRWHQILPVNWKFAFVKVCTCDMSWQGLCSCYYNFFILNIVVVKSHPHGPKKQTSIFCKLELNIQKVCVIVAQAALQSCTFHCCILNPWWRWLND